VRRMGIGLQLYTLREELEQDFRGTLRKVAALGYEGVEFAGYGGLAAEELKQLLDELNLKAIGAHVKLNQIKDNLEQEIAYLQVIGAPYLICPFILPEDRQKGDGWKPLFDLFGRAGGDVREKGLRFAYHNHAFEFEDKVGGDFVFDALYSSTSADAVLVEMDVCWVQYAGQNPLEYIQRYAGRLPLLHLKDFKRSPDNPMDTVELGLGEVDLHTVIQASSDAGVEWLIVEQDHCANPPMTSVAASMQWLRDHYLSKF
jgi:sugar phosphate isomerase/epimerase